LDLEEQLECVSTSLSYASVFTDRPLVVDKHSETRRQHLPDAGAVLCLQGKLWHAHRDIHKAVDCYVEALKLNPFLWDAFLGLCETGANVRPPNIYKMTPEMYAMLTASPSLESLAASEKPVPLSHPLQAQPNTNCNLDPFVAANSRTDNVPTFGSSALWEKLNGSNVSVSSLNTITVEGMETPVAQSESDDIRLGSRVSREPSWEPPLAPARKQRTAQGMGAEYGLDPPPKMKAATTMKSRSRPKVDSEDASSGRELAVPVAGIGDRKRTVSGHIASTTSSQPTEPGAPQRRSVRLFNQIRPTTGKFSATCPKEGREIKKVKATGVKGRTASGSMMPRTVSGTRRPAGASESTESESREGRTAGGGVNGSSLPGSRSAAPDRSKDVEALTSALDLFCKLATGYLALTCYRCQEAVQTFNQLPQNQRETPWVLSQIGRAYYEQALYSEAEKYFVRVRSLAPSRLEDMEVYSTVLWHLKNEVELSYLAHELMAIDRLAPQSWCAIGNAFSLQGEHSQALKCFKRATQLDPRFAYAFTLQGHEYVSNEEHDKALDAYRHAIAADSRHYNAWYGLGKVYERMGNFSFAEQHYRTASTINPTNVVLICCIGLVLERMGNEKAALILYGRACSLSPQSVLARIRKARTLMKLGELKLAHIELKVLKDVAPDEANVHYLLGKLYKMMHDKGNAIKHFTTALNLDPKVCFPPSSLLITRFKAWF
jgi:anaphase-promoting complex subunit 3